MSLWNPIKLVPNASQSANGSSSSIGLKGVKKGSFFLNVVSVTVGTLDVDIEIQDPVTGAYFVVASFTQATGATSEVIQVGGGNGTLLDETARVTWTIVTGPAEFSVGFRGSSE